MTDIVIDEDGIPRFADRRIAVTVVVAQIGTSSHSVESFAEEYYVNETDVRAALRWAAGHPQMVDAVYRRRVDALHEEVLEFSGEVEPPGETDPEEYLRRVRGALDEVRREWQPYRDSRWEE